VINAQLPRRADGKPHTNKDYEVQGWNAKLGGFKIEDCPYYATSTAEKLWKKGFQS
jgi:hypothetical protein